MENQRKLRQGFLYIGNIVEARLKDYKDSHEEAV